MIEKPRSDVMTLSKTFYDLWVSRNLVSKAEMHQIGAALTEDLTYEWLIYYLLENYTY